MVEKRLGNLEKSVTKIMVHQAGINQSVAGINNTLVALADTKAESLHLMKSLKQANIEREDIFKRLRTVEAGRVGCVANQDHTRKAIDNLDADVDALKLWKSAHISTAKAAEAAGLKAGRFWGVFFGACGLLVSLFGLYLKVTGKI